MADGASLDWKNVHVIYGPHRIQGRAKGTTVSLVMGADANAVQVGIDGTGYFIMSEDRSGTCTVLLTPESESNDVLSEFLEADRSTPGGLKLPLIIEDANGRTVMAAASAKIVKLPDVSYSDGGDTRAWAFVGTRFVGTVGGMGTTPVNQG